MCCLTAENKDLRPLATLTCSVLQKCLPKVPLPMQGKGNPVKFKLPSVTTVDGCEGRQTSGHSMSSRHSAPQLGGVMTALKEQVALQKSTKPVVTEASTSSLPQGKISSQSSLSSTEDFPRRTNPFSDRRSGETSRPSEHPKASSSQEDSEVSLVAKAIAFTVGDSSHQLDLMVDSSDFDKFFPEFVDDSRASEVVPTRAGGIRTPLNRSHSYPLLDRIASSTSFCDPITSPDLHTYSRPQTRVGPRQDLPAIVIPTGREEPGPNDSEEPTTNSFLKRPFTDEECTVTAPPPCPKSVLQFTAQAPPCTMGLVSPHHPEPLYKKTPATNRYRTFGTYTLNHLCVLKNVIC